VPQQANAENLLDIDFDGAAPASAQGPPPPDSSGLAGLSGAPQLVENPSGGAPVGGNSLDDLMGVFGGGDAHSQNNRGDLMNGFVGLDLGGPSQPPPPPGQQMAAKKNKEDILGLF